MATEHLTPEHLWLKDALRDGTLIYIAPRAGRPKRTRLGVTLVPDKYRNRHQKTAGLTYYELLVNYRDARVNELVTNEMIRVLSAMDRASELVVHLGRSLDDPDCLRFAVTGEPGDD